MSASPDLSANDRRRVAKAFKDAHDNEPPPTLAIIGEAGVGKTSTINALFNAGQPVSAQRATTLDAVSMLVEAPVDELIVSGARGLLRVFDMPGLGDRMSTYGAYRSLYMDILPQADVILWVHPAEDRMVQFVQTALLDLFAQHLPELLPRLVFGLNKADRISPDDWNRHANVPSNQQIANLNAREVDFTDVVREVLPRWRAKAITYSALTRYQLPALFKQMMYAMPERRRWVLEERMSLANFFDLVDKGVLKAAEERVQRPPVPVNTQAEPEPTTEKNEDSISAPEEALRKLKELNPKQYEALVRDPEKLVRFLHSGPGDRRA